MRPVAVAACIFLVALAGCTATGTEQHGPAATFATGQGNVTLSLVAADEPSEWEQGLMHREDLPRDGMLFVFPREAERTFWMANTSIPLDIIFVSGEGRVVNVAEADPDPGVPPSDLTRYRSDGPARWVVETRQGFSREHGIGPGTRVWIRP